MCTSTLFRVLAAGVVAACAAFIFGELSLVEDLFWFELRPLMNLVGFSGLVVIGLSNAGALILAWRAILFLRGKSVAPSRVSTLILFVAIIVALWVMEYVFMETPVTVRLAMATRGDGEIAVAHDSDGDAATFSLARRTVGPDARHRLRTMYERIRINNPEAFARHPIGATIDKYARRYDVDATFLFFRAYINSFYGEAVSGPVPFLRAMTAESIRDVIQIHVPAWFIESEVRRWLISSSFFNRTLGSQLGFKLKYAFHKANLDVSTQPYDVSTFSDVLLVMREYPEEFPDVFASSEQDPVREALHEAFVAVADGALRRPYEDPYHWAAFDDDYYDAKRADLKRFTRAAYYLTATDFDFATRIQALLSLYQTRYYERRLGGERWAGIPDWQKIVMLAMTRDLYTPNVGHLGYNLYTLPELNCTPVNFVASEASRNPAVPGAGQAGLWRPDHYEYLWAAAGPQLRVLNEVWVLLNEDPIPGVRIDDTVDAARRVIALAKQWP